MVAMEMAELQNCLSCVATLDPCAPPLLGDRESTIHPQQVGYTLDKTQRDACKPHRNTLQIRDAVCVSRASSLGSSGVVGQIQDSQVLLTASDQHWGHLI